MLKIVSVVVLSLTMAASSASAAPVLITFEDILGMSNSPGTAVPAASQLSNDYLALTGALFSSGSPFVAVVDLGPGVHAITPPNGIGGVDALGRLSYGTPIQVTFFDAISGLPGVTDFVSIRGDRIATAGSATLTAFGLTGLPLGSVTAADTSAGLTLMLSVPGIHRIVLTETSATIAFDNFQFNAPVAPAAIPEPSSVLLLGTGFGVLGRYMRRRRVTPKANRH